MVGSGILCGFRDRVGAGILWVQGYGGFRYIVWVQGYGGFRDMVGPGLALLLCVCV
jgi:hypothetical protein